MNTFDKLLNEALDNTSEVSASEFINFATAIVTSTSADKIPLAIEKAMALSSSELTSIIKQVQFTGDIRALRDALDSNNKYFSQFLMLGRKVLSRGSEGELQTLIRRVHTQKDGDSLDSYKEGDPCPCHNHGPLTHEPGDEGDLICSSVSSYGNRCGFRAQACGNCGKMRDVNDFNRESNELECDDCTEPEETYNAEGDYYNQGEDPGGH